MTTKYFDQDDEFVPGGLYIMISVPTPYYLGTTPHEYPTEVPLDISFANYNTEAATGLYREEFHWDLYFHRHRNGGRVYRLSQLQAEPPIYVHNHVDIKDPRQLGQVIGFMRLVQVDEASVPAVERYIDTITRNSAAHAARTFVWAVTAAYSLRKNLGGGCAEEHFTLSRFTEELLCFAYSHVQGVLGLGALSEKSIARSWFNVKLSLDVVEKTLDARRAKEAMLMRRPKWTWAWYN